MLNTLSSAVAVVVDLKDLLEVVVEVLVDIELIVPQL
jgi:hypothetical protein